MTRSAFNHVFITEWAHHASSRKFRIQVQSWKQASDALITASTADEVVQKIQSKSDPALGAQVAGWLLARSTTDDAAARVLLQALAPTVKGEAKHMDRNNRSLSRRECESLCVSAAGLAVARKAGTHLAWPMWALYGAMRQEIRAINKSVDDQAVLLPDLLDTVFAAAPDCRAAVELGLVLQHATTVGTISVTDAQLLFLRAVCGVPTSDIAADLGIAESSVRKKQARLVHRVSLAMAA